MIIYVESSAAVKLLLRETESEAMRDFLEGFAVENHTVVASSLVETELRRAAARGGAAQVSVTKVLDSLDVVEIERRVFTAAGLLPGENLRSFDALHIATALDLEADMFVSYDARQVQSAAAAGLHVVSPA